MRFWRSLERLGRLDASFVPSSWLILARFSHKLRLDMELKSFKRRIVIVRRVLSVTLVLFAVVMAAGSFIQIEEEYEANGIVRAADDLSVYALCDGFVKEMLAYEGDYVEKGAPLYRLEVWDLEERQVQLQNERRELAAELALQESHIAHVEQTAMPPWLAFSEVEIERSENLVEHRKSTLKMLEKLNAEGLISKLAFEKAELELSQAEADRDRSLGKELLLTDGYVETAIAEARAQADVLRSRIESATAKEELLLHEFQRRTLAAPEASTVTLALVRSPGEPVKKGQELMRLSASNRLRLDLYGPERNIHQLRPGQHVRFESEIFSSFIEGYCYGKVDLISSDRTLGGPSDKTGGFAGPYYIRVEVEESPIPLKLGSTVHASIELGKRPLYKILFGLE